MNEADIAQKAWGDLRRYLHLMQLSRDLGLSRNAAAGWKIVPERHVEKIVFLTGIPAHRQRPDLFNDPWSDLT